MHTTRPLRIIAIKLTRITRMVLRQRTVQIRSAALTQQIRIVSRRADGDSLRRAVEEVAHIVRELLQFIGLERNVVFDDDVVCRTRGALQTLVCLEPELAEDAAGDAAVDDGAGEWVPGSSILLGVVVRVFLFSRIEASMVALAYDDDGDLGVLSYFAVSLLESLDEGRQLMLEHELVLAFGDSIAVDDDLGGQLVVLLAPQVQPLQYHCLQALHHLLSSSLRADATGPLKQVLIYAGNDACNAGRTLGTAWRRMRYVNADEHGVVVQRLRKRVRDLM